MSRFIAVNSNNNRGRTDAAAMIIPLTIRKEGTVGKVDFHYQSLSTLRTIIDDTIRSALAQHTEVWLVCGAGNNVDRKGFQKAGGVLEGEVENWLQHANMRYAKGKGGGSGGALLIY
jgi:hypothetical protein